MDGRERGKEGERLLCMFFSHQADAELMSPPAATTMELLQVKVIADFLEQSFPNPVWEEVCKIQ